MTLAVRHIAARLAYPPRVTEFTRTFWTALEQGRFVTTKCRRCGLLSFQPKPYCPHCWHRETAWTELTGRGRLYSRTRIHAVPAVFADEPLPLHVGIADLAEGLRIAARIDSPDPLPLDSPIRLGVLRYEDGALLTICAATGVSR